MCIVDLHTHAMVSSEDEVDRVSPERSTEKKTKVCKKKRSDGKSEPKKKPRKAVSKTADPEKPKKRAPRAKTIAVVRKTAFEVFPEGHPPADKNDVTKMIAEFMEAFVQNTKRKDVGFQTMGENAELRYLNQLSKNPDAQPEKRSVARDNRTAFTPSSNPSYDPRVLTHSDEEEYETPVIEEPVHETCTDRSGAQHTFDSRGYHRRDQLVYPPEYIKRIPAVSPAALQDDEMRELHEKCSKLVFDKLMSGDETTQADLKILSDYNNGLIVTDLKDWATLLCKCAKLVLDCETDSDDEETVDWSVTSSMCGDSDVGVLVGEIEDFIDSLDA